MRPMLTWSGESCFCYSGSVELGTKIRYGSGHNIEVSARQYSSLLDQFKGREIKLGPSRTVPPTDSVGNWLQEHVTKTAIASYVGPILIEEGYAEKGSTSSKIRFK